MTKLCINQHEFAQERRFWPFVDTAVFNAEFKACSFVNDAKHCVNFTNCIFGAHTVHVQPMKLDNMALTAESLDSCRFDKSATSQPFEFKMSYVTFKNCAFQSDTLFKLAKIFDLTFHNCRFK